MEVEKGIGEIAGRLAIREGKRRLGDDFLIEQVGECGSSDRDAE